MGKYANPHNWMSMFKELIFIYKNVDVYAYENKSETRKELNKVSCKIYPWNGDKFSIEIKKKI